MVFIDQAIGINISLKQQWREKQYSYYLVDACFQGVNKLFVLSFEDNTHKTSCKRYFLPPAEIKNYNVMIDGRNFFDKPRKMI